MTARLLDAALNSSSDLESFKNNKSHNRNSCLPNWLFHSEKIKGDMITLKNKIEKLKE